MEVSFAEEWHASNVVRVQHLKDFIKTLPPQICRLCVRELHIVMTTRHELRLQDQDPASQESGLESSPELCRLLREVDELIARHVRKRNSRLKTISISIVLIFEPSSSLNQAEEENLVMRALPWLSAQVPSVLTVETVVREIREQF